VAANDLEQVPSVQIGRGKTSHTLSCVLVRHFSICLRKKMPFSLLNHITIIITRNTADRQLRMASANDLWSFNDLCSEYC